MDVIIAGVHRSPWLQGPGESWMELIPAVEFPNFDINIAMNTQSGHFQQGGAKMCMRLLQISKFVYTFTVSLSSKLRCSTQQS